MAPNNVATAHTSGLGNMGRPLPFFTPTKEATASAAALGKLGRSRVAREGVEPTIEQL